ncbi:unnamed protein product [Rotaria sp. Silwood1]|nr:unnamed protein product [Rotaria sp. Silwood1]CAF4685400.1 unnamed protein product [Rotaria sp. Silwood1]
MNRVGFAAQTMELFNNDVMNPQQKFKWMDKPAGDSSPLAFLKPLDSLLVKQIVSVTEFMLSMTPQSKYGIFNDRGEQVYYAFEESDFCQRVYCPANRQFDLHIEIIRVKREFKCCAGSVWCACCAACSHEIIVESPPGTVIGYVTQECSFHRVHYALKDANDNVVLKIVGPGCMCDGPLACCCENKFTLIGTDGESEIGSIHKKYRGYLAEALTSADTFTIKVPLDLDVRMKAVALSALFLIDFAHFSEPPRRKQQFSY